MRPHPFRKVPQIGAAKRSSLNQEAFSFAVGAHWRRLDNDVVMLRAKSSPRSSLEAWREVDDALVVYDAEQLRRDKLTTVVALNERALSIAQQRYKAGALDYLDVLNVQKQLLDAQSNLEHSRASAAANLITLCKALGGGWESTYGNPSASR